MAIKRVWIEEDCIACGTCEAFARKYSLLQIVHV